MPDTMSVDAYRDLLNRQEREEVCKSHRKNYLTESLIQQACVQWFRYQYPDYGSLLFAVPNGARRSHATASRMKAEGMVSGVADLILLVPRGRFASLCIEMKTRRAGSKQGDRQKSWQQDAEAVGNKYVICKSLEDFRREVTLYMSQASVYPFFYETKGVPDTPLSDRL